nr:MAG TPA: hypothetical protein [Caudoviricetes sp.]
MFKFIDIILPIVVIFLHFELALSENTTDIVSQNIPFFAVDISDETMVYLRFSLISLSNELLEVERGEQSLYPREPHHHVLPTDARQHHSTAICVRYGNAHFLASDFICSTINVVYGAIYERLKVFYNDGLINIEPFPNISGRVTQSQISQILIDIDTAQLIDMVNRKPAHECQTMLLKQRFLNKDGSFGSDLSCGCRKHHIPLTIVKKSIPYDVFKHFVVIRPNNNYIVVQLILFEAEYPRHGGLKHRYYIFRGERTRVKGANSGMALQFILKLVFEPRDNRSQGSNLLIENLNHILCRRVNLNFLTQPVYLTISGSLCLLRKGTTQKLLSNS